MNLITRIITFTAVTLFLSQIKIVACDDSLRHLILENLPAHTFPSSKKQLQTTIPDEENTIALSHEDLTGEKVKNLVEQIIIDPQRSNIQKINLSHNLLRDEDAISLASTIDFLDNLKELDVRNNNIGIVGLQAILLKMKTHKSEPYLLCSMEGFSLENILIKGLFHKQLNASEYSLFFKKTDE